MSDHLPECPLFRPCRGNANGMHIPQGTVAGIPVTICGMCMHDCICPALRACTVRVLGEVREAVAEIADWYPADVFPKPTGPSDSSDRHGAEMARVTVRNAIAAIDRLAQEAP